MPPPRRSFARTLVILMFLVGGTAAMAGYLIKRNKSNASKQKVVEIAHDAAVVVESDAAPLAVPVPIAVEIDAGVPVDGPVVIDAAVVVADASVDLQVMPGSTKKRSRSIRRTSKIRDTEAGSAAPPVDEEKDAPQTIRRSREARAGRSRTSAREKRSTTPFSLLSRARRRSRSRASTRSTRSSRTAVTSRSCSAISTSTRRGGRSRWTTTAPRSRRTAATATTRS